MPTWYCENDDVERAERMRELPGVPALKSSMVNVVVPIGVALVEARRRSRLEQNADTHLVLRAEVEVEVVGNLDTVGLNRCCSRQRRRC